MSTTASGTVLLVDDDSSLLRATAGVLRHHGFEVECHGNAAPALAAMEARRFDVLVTDLQLPEHSGIDLVRRAVDAGCGMSAIVITGMPTVQSAVEALRLSAIDYMVKPFQPLELVERVRRGVETSRARTRVADARKHTEGIARMLDEMRMVLDTPGVTSGTNGAGAANGSAMRGLSSDERSSLSPREIEVIGFMVGGKAPKEIASALFISQHTVRNHLRSIYAKLGVHSQIELLRKVAG
jgi:FixJ family two-component response regulator